MDFPYLSTIVFLPVIGAIVIALLPGANPRRIKLAAAAFTAVSFFHYLPGDPLLHALPQF